MIDAIFVRAISKKRRRFWLALSLVATLAPAGCQKKDAAPALVNVSDSASRPTATKVSAARRLTLSHDFGVVNPGKLDHVFEIKNSSTSMWTIDTIERTCTCTACRPSTKAIAPGETAQVAMEYKTGDQSTDRTQTTSILFKESEAPIIALVIKAQIRTPLTVAPREINLGALAEGSMAVAQVAIQNYSSADWQGVAIKSAPSWLKLELIHDARSPGSVPRQSWRVLASVIPDVMKLGIVREEIIVASDDGAHTVSIPIDVRVIGPVTVAPSQLFFGRLAAGKSAKRCVIFAFCDDCARDAIEDAAIRHDLKHDLKFEWKELSPKRWELSVDLTASAAQGFASGQVEVEFTGGKLPKTTIPTTVLVTDQEPNRDNSSP